MECMVKADHNDLCIQALVAVSRYEGVEEHTH